MRVKDVDFEIIPDFAFELGYIAAKKPRNNQRAAARSAWSMSSTGMLMPAMSSAE